MDTTRRHRKLASGALGVAVALSFVGLAATATAAAAQPAAPAADVIGEGAPGAIKDNYIVVFKPDTPAARQVAPTADKLADRYDGDVTRTYDRSVRGFSGKFSSAEAHQVAADPSVDYVEQDRTVSIAADQSNPTWGLDRIDQRSLPLSKSYGYAGDTSNVTAYIIDTGIRTGHSDFGGRARDGRDFIDNDAVANDCQGHGTHVAGTVGGAKYGVAKEAKLVGVRVLDCQGSGSYSQIIAGVDWVTKNAVKPAVANMSLGGSTSKALDDAVRRSITSGVTYALAAGNDNKNACSFSPARTAEAITVGATDKADKRASFSNYGTCLDLFAPGVNILSAGHKNNTATATMSGTSMASPHVAGAAAVYLAANPTAKPAQVRDALVDGATAGKVTSPASGSPNKLLFTGVAAPAPTQPTTPPTQPTTPPTQPTTPPTQPTTPAPTQPAEPTCGRNQTANTTIVAKKTVTSSIKVSDCAGKASTVSRVFVNIKHPTSGNLKVKLVAPNGKVTRLHELSGSTADNIVKTYTFDGSSSARDGAWKLQVTNTGTQGGYVDAWALAL